MAKLCQISLYNVVTNGKITYGYRCRTHGVMTQRFSTQAIRDSKIAEHRAKPKSTKKY